MNVLRFHNIVQQFNSIIRNMSSLSDEMEYDVDSVNGLVLFNYFLAEEILAKVLTFVSWEDLRSCRLVCQTWKRLIDSIVCLDKLKLYHTNVLKNSFTCSDRIVKPNDVPFYLCYAIAHNTFGVNHLKNPFGQDCPKFKDWTILASHGNGWTVEDTPVGSQPVPPSLGGTSCFTTSFRQCVKEQFIILEECGLSNKIMDEIQPHIEISEWYAKRFDCGIVYSLSVVLLNNRKEAVRKHVREVRDVDGTDDWHQVTHTFKDYGPGVRYITFRHGGSDTQYWAGHYGSKMAGGSVVAKIDLSSLLRHT